MRINADIIGAEFHKRGSSYDLALIANFLHPFSIHPLHLFYGHYALAAMRIHSPNSKEFLKVTPSHESISPLRKSASIVWSCAPVNCGNRHKEMPVREALRCGFLSNTHRGELVHREFGNLF